MKRFIRAACALVCALVGVTGCNSNFDLSIEQPSTGYRTTDERISVTGSFSLHK